MMRYTIPELLEREKYCVMTPCVYDCSSAKAVELAGYKAMLLSGGEVGESLGAIDEDEMTEDEMLFVASHICDSSPLPLVIDCGCFRPNPLSVLRWAKKFADAGCGALLIEDEDGVDRDTFIQMVKAAIAACEGTKCVVIARSNHDLETDEDFEYVADLLNTSMDCGAFMTMAVGLNSREKAIRIATMVKGLKMYPDQSTHNGVPEVEGEEIYALGYAMVSFHYTMKIAMAEIIRYGIDNLKAGHSGPSDEVKLINGYTGPSALTLWNYQDKYDRLARITGGERRVFYAPGDFSE